MQSLFLLLLLVPNLVLGDNSKTLIEFIANHPKWHMINDPDWIIDKDNIIQIGLRCTAVHDVAILHVYKKNESELYEVKDALKKVTKIFMTSSLAIAEENNWDSNIFNEKYSFWRDKYINNAKENELKYSNFRRGLVDTDISVCAKILPFFSEILKKKINRNQND
tara:strand:- start:781 stop:1275 length:495 start_codon:yes stop_codon:yes gene_type:complete